MKLEVSIVSIVILIYKNISLSIACRTPLLLNTWSDLQTHMPALWLTTIILLFVWNCCFIASKQLETAAARFNNDGDSIENDTVTHYKWKKGVKTRKLLSE